MTDSYAAPIILCFGDSLTAGYQTPIHGEMETVDTPYGSFLQETLGDKGTVLTSGICGELTGEMVMRFRESVLSKNPSFVIILGGTNDLGWNGQPEDIMRNLLKMYELAQHHGIEPIAFSVPSIRPVGMEGHPEAESWVRDHIERRLALNALIRDYCLSHSLHFIDLFQATSDPDSLLLAERFSNDGLHLTTLGYRYMAQLLVDQVFGPRWQLQQSTDSKHS